MSEVSTVSPKKTRGRPRKAVAPTPVFHPLEDASIDQPTTNKNTRGFCGEAVKIRIYGQDGQHDHADPWVPLTLGDLPTVWVCRGFDWIIPIESLSVLKDTATEAFELIPLKYPNARGDLWERREFVKNRFPFQILGPATWDEYEAFKAKLAHTGKPVDA